MSIAQASRGGDATPGAEAAEEGNGRGEDRTELCRPAWTTPRCASRSTSRTSARRTSSSRFPDGQTHDFAVLDSAGREVYRWGDGRMFTQSLQNRTIEDGETLRIAEHATPSLPQGSYVAVATLRSTNFPVEERVAFELR